MHAESSSAIWLSPRRQAMGLARLLMELLFTVVVCEVLVMFALPVIAPGVRGWQEALLAAALLTLLAGPLVTWRALVLMRREVHGVALDRDQAKLSAQKTAFESAALLRTVDQFSMVCVTAPDGGIIEVNDAFCQACGYSRDELTGQNPRLISSATQDAFFWIGAWQTLLHGQIWSGEVCNKTKNGALYWVRCVISPVLDVDQKPVKYISVAYDITEAHRAQEAMAAGAERYNLVIEGGNDGMWDWPDVRASDEWWSPQFFRLLGYEPNEVPANRLTFNTMLHPADKQACIDAIDRALQACESVDMECRLRNKSAQYMWCRLRAKVYFDDFGAPTRMAGSLQDIHERKVTQIKIKEQSQQVTAIFALSPDGFVSFDLQGCVSYVSPGFAHLTGIPSAAMLGLHEDAFSMRLFERVEPQQQIRCLADVKQVAHEGCGAEVGTRARAVLEMRAPGRRLLELSLNQSEGGSVSQILHLRDVTHESEVDQMKSDFLSMAAHELRTPMASIYGFTELLLTRELKPEKQKELLGRIYRQSEAIVTIINELLDLSRIEARRGKDFELVSCNLVDIAQDVLLDFKLPPARHPPVWDGPIESVMVLVDAQKMRQAILNVVCNAYKYSPQGGDVFLRLVSQLVGDRQQVGLQIQDHGLGLSPDQLARLGERFYRADTSGRIAGTGLGVTMVKEIMVLLGGKMDVASQIGQGTTVTLWLPHVEANVT
ncbi:MAG: PAS domain S-box protein [Aquabacterium sp.]|nr:PAS domain S-box protein [Aquabacterium sp.]